MVGKVVLEVAEGGDVEDVLPLSIPEPSVMRVANFQKRRRNGEEGRGGRVGGGRARPLGRKLQEMCVELAAAATEVVLLAGDSRGVELKRIEPLVPGEAALPLQDRCREGRTCPMRCA